MTAIKLIDNMLEGINKTIIDRYTKLDKNPGYITRGELEQQLVYSQGSKDALIELKRQMIGRQ